MTSRRIEKQDRQTWKQAEEDRMCVSVRPCSVSAACCFDATHCSTAPGPASTGYLLGLYTAAPSFPSVLLSLPPAVCANSPSVALIPSFPRAWTHANESKHVCTLYILIVRAARTLHTSSLCENITYSSNNKVEASAAVLFLGHATFYPTCPWYVEQW